MKIINHKIETTITVKRMNTVIKFLGIPTKMKDCGLTVSGDDDDIFPVHITNCLRKDIVFKYIKRFLECETKDEARYIKILYRRGMVENQEVIIDNKPAKILHWEDSNKYMPMYVHKTTKGIWGKQKRMLYGNTMVEGYKNFNND